MAGDSRKLLNSIQPRDRNSRGSSSTHATSGTTTISSTWSSRSKYGSLSSVCLSHTVAKSSPHALSLSVQPNASTILSAARTNGDKTYDPRTAIKVYYSQVGGKCLLTNPTLTLVTGTKRDRNGKLHRSAHDPDASSHDIRVCHIHGAESLCTDRLEWPAKFDGAADDRERPPDNLASNKLDDGEPSTVYVRLRPRYSCGSQY